MNWKDKFKINPSGWRTTEYSWLRKNLKTKEFEFMSPGVYRVTMSDGREYVYEAFKDGIYIRNPEEETVFIEAQNGRLIVSVNSNWHKLERIEG